MTEWARKRFSMSFSGLLQIQALVVAVPLLALATFLLWSMQQVWIHDASRVRNAEAAIVSSELDATVLQARRSLQWVARQPEVRALDPRLRPKVLDLWGGNDSTAMNLAIVDMEGRVLHRSADGGNPASPNLSGTSEFKSFQRSPSPKTFSPGISHLTGRWRVLLVEPIRDGAGNVIGMLSAGLPLGRLRDLVARIDLPTGGVITVVDSSGIVVARSTDPSEWIGKSVRAPVLAMITSGSIVSGDPVKGIDGIPRIYAVSDCQAAPWRVLVGIPPSIPLRAARKQFAILLGGALYAGAISIALGTLASRRMGESCDGLVTATQRHARGEFGALAPVRGPREMRLVAESFNAMVEARQRMSQDLNAAHRRIGTARQEILNIIEGISDAFVACDKNFVYTFVNRKAGELLGNPPEKLIGRSMWELYPEGLGEIFERNYTAAMREQTFREIEAYYPPWDRWFENRIFPTAHGLLIFFSDITQRRAERAERVELEARARRNEMLAAMGALVASVAHEARSPLFGITATVDVLRREFEGQHGATKYLDSLKLATDRLSRLMSDLLEYARPPREETKPVDIHRAARTAIQLCRSDAENGLVQVDAAGGAEFLVAADEERLALAFRNLISNAIAHSPRGGRVRLEFEAVRHQDRDAVECRVTDNGKGFEAEHLEKAFEPFFTTRATGTGLGLFIVKRIVEDAGGAVRIQNEPEGGACAVMVLPTLRPAGERGSGREPARGEIPGKPA